MPKQTMHRDSRSPPNRAPAQSDPSASRRAETIVPAAGFRTFPQRPQTDARTAPVSIPGQNHTRKSSPSAGPGTPDRTSAAPKIRPRPTALAPATNATAASREGKRPLKKQNRTIRNYRSASRSRRTNSRTACREKSSPCEVRICPVVGCSSICFSPLS